MTAYGLRAACEDRSFAQTYRTGAPMPEPEPMTNATLTEVINAADVLLFVLKTNVNPDLQARWNAQGRLERAIAALRAQPEHGPQRDYEAEIAHLTKDRDDIELQKCNWVRKARDAEYRVERLERIVDVLLSRIDGRDS